MMNYEGLVPLLGGIYGYLLAIGYLPRSPKDAEKEKLWRKKFGATMKVVCPITVLYGFFQLIDVLPSTL